MLLLSLNNLKCEIILVNRVKHILVLQSFIFSPFGPVVKVLFNLVSHFLYRYQNHPPKLHSFSFLSLNTSFFFILFLIFFSIKFSTFHIYKCKSTFTCQRGNSSNEKMYYIILLLMIYWQKNDFDNKSKRWRNDLRKNLNKGPKLEKKWNFGGPK